MNYELFLVVFCNSRGRESCFRGGVYLVVALYYSGKHGEGKDFL